LMQVKDAGRTGLKIDRDSELYAHTKGE
jgi:hypothetical protein